MSKIISIHSFRGGTGKSNITANLAVTVARAGNRVGVIDTDIQSPGIHVLFGLKEDKVDKALNNCLWGECPIEDASYDVSAAARQDGEPEDRVPGLFLIPSSLNAGEITRVLKEGYDIRRLNEGFRQLIDELKLDYLIIDTHPGVNEETLLSITISDLLLVVMRPDNQDFRARPLPSS
jgi:septum site-determining protein MinD